MNELQINTTQNVNIDFRAASVGERMLAFLVDFILFILYIWVWGKFLPLGPILDSFEDSSSASGMFILIFSPLGIYTLVCESLMEGQTIGKKLLKIKVAKIDGYQTTFLDFLIRWFFRMIDVYFFLVLIIFMNNLALIPLALMLSPIIGLITMVVNKKTQRFGDMVAGTVVISLRNKFNIEHTIFKELNKEYVPTYPQVIKLSDNDARIIKETFIMARENRDYKILIKLRDKIQEVTGIVHQERNDAVFIDKVLKDYNYYTQDM